MRRSRSSPGASPTSSSPARSSGPGRSSVSSGKDVHTFFDLLFLSFTNLTSVGLSDIVPVLGHARSLVMVEQVAGVLYVALVVARLVGLTVARQASKDRLRPRSQPSGRSFLGSPSTTSR